MSVAPHLGLADNTLVVVDGYSDTYQLLENYVRVLCEGEDLRSGEEYFPFVSVSLKLTQEAGPQKLLKELRSYVKQVKPDTSNYTMAYIAPWEYKHDIPCDNNYVYFLTRKGDLYDMGTEGK